MMWCPTFECAKAQVFRRLMPSESPTNRCLTSTNSERQEWHYGHAVMHAPSSIRRLEHPLGVSCIQWLSTVISCQFFPVQSEPCLMQSVPVMGESRPGMSIVASISLLDFRFCRSLQVYNWQMWQIKVVLLQAIACKTAQPELANSMLLAMSC